MGITPKPSGNVINSYSGNSDKTYQIEDSSRYWIGLSIINDGLSDLAFVVNNIRITVQHGETFDDNFEDFQSIKIETNVNYRLVLRG